MTSMASTPLPDAVILAGGLGTRLRSVVPDRQKAFADVAAEPFVARLLRLLEGAGVPRVVFALGHLADSALPYLDAWSRSSPAELRSVTETEPLGTGGALRNALDATRSDPVLVLNGDSFVALDLPALLATHAASGCMITLCAVHVADAARFGLLDIDERSGRVRGFHEKRGLAEPGWINAGIYVIARPLIAEMPIGCPLSLERDVFPRHAGNIAVHRAHGPFIDIGTPESFAAGAGFFTPA